MCLKAGEPYRLARAFAVQSWYASNDGAHNRPQTEKLVAYARGLAKSSGRQHVIALCLASEGGCDYLMGQWKSAAERCREGVRELKVRREGTTYEIDSLTVFGLSAMALAGEFEELAVQVPKEIREADERRDRFASVNLRLGHINALWLVADDVETATRRCEEASQFLSKSAFHVQHYYDMLARMHIDLYRGDAASALERVEANWEALWNSMLTRVQHPRMFGYYLRIRASAAYAWDVEGPEQRRLLSVVDKFSKKLGAESATWGGPAAQSVLASAEALRGNDERARDLLASAIEGFARVDMPVHAAAVRRRLGELTGGDEGAQLVHESNREMREHCVVDPEKLTAIYAPRCA